MGYGFFQDDNGNNSSARLRAFIALMVFLAVWSAVAVMKKEMPSIPESTLIFILTICGYPIAQKIWAERKSEDK